MSLRAACLSLTIITGCANFSAGCGVEGPREILVVAKGMTFILPSDPDTANPVIRLRRGEHVSLVLRNEAPGLLHNIEIPAWTVKSDRIRAGEETSVTFEVPSQQGPTEYRCAPHSEMMHGFVEVSAP